MGPEDGDDTTGQQGATSGDQSAIGRRRLLGGLGACAVCAAAGFGVGRLTSSSSKRATPTTGPTTGSTSTSTSSTSRPGAPPTDARTSIERRADQPDALFSVNT